MDYHSNRQKQVLSVWGKKNHATFALLKAKKYTNLQ